MTNYDVNRTDVAITHKTLKMESIFIQDFVKLFLLRNIMRFSFLFLYFSVQIVVVAGVFCDFVNILSPVPLWQPVRVQLLSTKPYPPTSFRNLCFLPRQCHGMPYKPVCIVPENVILRTL